MKVTTHTQSLKTALEYLGGSAEQIDASAEGEPVVPAVSKFERLVSSWWFRGLWWGILAGIILLFCGQTSKFIYIDF